VLVVFISPEMEEEEEEEEEENISVGFETTLWALTIVQAVHSPN